MYTFTAFFFFAISEEFVNEAAIVILEMKLAFQRPQSCV